MSARPDERFAPRHPGRGRAVLACRCGQMLDSADMPRPDVDRGDGAAVRVEPIVCADCAGSSW